MNNHPPYRCIYCPSDSPPLPEGTRREHIILSSLGGSLKSSEIVCNSCQSFFSEGESDSKEGIDSTFAKNFGIIIAHLGISGTTRHLIDPNTGEKIKLGLWGKPEIAGKVTFLGKEGEKMKYEVCAPTKDAAKRMLSSTTKAPRYQINQAIDKVHVQQQWLDNQFVDLKMGGGDIFACAAKMVFNYLGYCTRNEQLAHSLCFDKIRNFIRYGPYDGSYKLLHYNLINTNKIDNQFPGEQLPKFHHMIVISLDGASNKSYGFLRLFGGMEYGFELSNNYVGESASYVHIRNSAKEENYPPIQDKKIGFALITPSDFRSPVYLISRTEPHDEIEEILERFTQLQIDSQRIPAQRIIDENAEKLSNQFIEEIPESVFGSNHIAWIEKNLKKFLEYFSYALARNTPKFNETTGMISQAVIKLLIAQLSKDFNGCTLTPEEKTNMITNAVMFCATSFLEYFHTLNRAIKLNPGESPPSVDS